MALADLGLTDFGENRDQEAAPKAAAVAEATSAPVRWHFIGQLQTNKAHSVVRYASVVHSVDRVRLVRALGSASRAAAGTAPAGDHLPRPGQPRRRPGQRRRADQPSCPRSRPRSRPSRASRSAA